MKELVLIILGFFSTCVTSFGQVPDNKILFIIDSIPLLTDPEEWNQVLQDDIADINVITNRDSLKLLGWEQMAGITYIFTKEYRNRPDSVKKIPSLKQMISKNGLWTLNNNPYNGRYIDYYNNGRIQNEGWLLNGKTNGELIVYYKDGIKKSITNFKDGVRDGSWKEYYKNGMLMRIDEYANGKPGRTGKQYFINGQTRYELRLKSATRYDTAVSYYSTGKIRSMVVTKTGAFPQDKKQADLSYYTTMFSEYLRTGDIKAANKSFYRIWLLDSINIDTYFKEGLLLAHEFRFDEAIALFDKALAIEPLLKEALEHRALARIKKYKLSMNKTFLNEKKNINVTLEDIMLTPEEEEAKVCNDLLLADDIDPGVNYNNKAVPESILNYCRNKRSR